MFNTLRTSNHADGSYVLEPTDPPFNRRRQGKLPRVACAQCRARKLKCSGDPNGCQRCLARHSRCEYGEYSHLRRKRPVGEPEQTPISPPASWLETARPMAEDDAAMAWEFPDVPDVAGLMEPLGMMPDADLNFSIPSQATTETQKRSPSLDRLSDSDTVLSSPSTACAATVTPRDLDRPASPMYSPNNSEYFTCACYRKVAGILESLELQLAPNPRIREKAASADEILLFQKKTLIQCEALVKCSPCMARSEFVMLIISICNRIMGSLEQIYRANSGSDEYPDQQGSQSQPERPRLWRWELDDEDELHILQSLLRTRLAKLGSLARETNRAAAKSRWMMHQAIVGDLVERIAETTLGVKLLGKRGQGP